MLILKVGDIAKKTGLTVKALHHYHKIGLLIPSHRSEAGYRLYSIEDLISLQKIKSLQELGFSLNEIKKVTQDDTASLNDILGKHIQHLSHHLKNQQRLLKRLESAI